MGTTSQEQIDNIKLIAWKTGYKLDEFSPCIDFYARKYELTEPMRFDFETILLGRIVKTATSPR